MFLQKLSKSFARSSSILRIPPVLSGGLGNARFVPNVWSFARCSSILRIPPVLSGGLGNARVVPNVRCSSILRIPPVLSGGLGNARVVPNVRCSSILRIPPVLSGGLRNARAVPNVRFYVSQSEVNKSVAAQSKSFVANIFKGQLELDHMFPYPSALNKGQEQSLRDLLGTFGNFLEKVNNPTMNTFLGKIDDHTMQGLKKMGAFGMQVPADLGGLGLSNTQYNRLMEKIGSHDFFVGTNIASHPSISFKSILLYGTEAQKQKYLPKLSTGEKNSAFCLAEPTSSTFKTTAVQSSCGKYFTLNGCKLWFCNGSLPEIFTVFAMMPMKNPKTGKMKEELSAFIVERSSSGVVICSNTHSVDVCFDNIRVPADCLLGEAGKGVKMAQDILLNENLGTTAALLGTMRGTISKVVAHATNVNQSEKKSDIHVALMFDVCYMTMLQYVAESMVYMISGNMDRGVTEFQTEAAICKIFTTGVAIYLSLAYNNLLGSLHVAERDRVTGHVGFLLRLDGLINMLKLYVMSSGFKKAEELLKRDKWVASLQRAVHPELEQSAELATKAFEQLEEQLIKHSIDNEVVLSDCVIHLFAMVVVLSRVSRSLSEGSPSAQHEKMLCEMWCAIAYQNIMKYLKVPHSKQYFNPRAIMEAVIKRGGVVAPHPLGF